MIQTNNLIQFDWRDENANEMTATVFADGSSSKYVLHDIDILRVLEHGMEAQPSEAICDFITSELEVGKDEADALLTELRDTGLLVSENHENFTRYQMWREKNWQRALFYHMKTRTTQTTVPTSAQESTDKKVIETTEDLTKPYTEFKSANLISLPEPSELPDDSFSEVALRRRTHRNFKGREIKLDNLSTLLYYSFETVKKAQDHIEMTPLSDIEPGAARSVNFEVYPVILRCEGLEPGIYQYSIQDHALSKLRAFETADEADNFVVEAAHEQQWGAGSAVTFFFTSVFEREQQWNSGSRGLRNTYISVSEHAHRLILVATALRLRNFLSPALKDSMIDDALGVNGIDEGVAYMVAIGE